MTHELIDPTHDHLIFVCPWCGASNQATVDASAGPWIQLYCGDCERVIDTMETEGI